MLGKTHPIPEGQFLQHVPCEPNGWQNIMAATQQLQPPSKMEVGRCENEALVRGPLQKLKLGDVTKALVRCFLQKRKLEDVKTKLWCEASFKNTDSINAKDPKPDLHGAADPTMIQDRSETVARQTLLQRLWRHVLYEKTQHFGTPAIFQKRISCEASFKSGNWKM